MNGCRKFEELLARHLDGDTLLLDREELEKHLAVCPDCERLYLGLSDVDRALRELPGKQVDPPPYLHARILANLPEKQAVPFRAAWWRPAAGLAVAAAGVVALAIAFHEGGGSRPDRVASVPAPAPVVQPAQPPRAAHPPDASAPAGAKEAPVLQSAPGSGKRGVEVASAPKVVVVKEVKVFFYYPPAQKVAVTGDFNNWDVNGVALQASGKPGLWETDLRLPPGAYSYNFIVDGELLVPDPNAPNQMPDGYGGTNSILLVQADSAI